MASYDITLKGTALEFDTTDCNSNSCYAIDSTHVINFWGGVLGDGFAQVFAVNTTTWAVTTAGAALEFDTQDGISNSCFIIDSNHFINFYRGLSGDGYVQTYTVNTTTWAITGNANLEFDTQNNDYNSCWQIDSNHFIDFWAGGTGTVGYAQVFIVNTTTWAVTTAANSLAINGASRHTDHSCHPVDSNHFIDFSQNIDNTEGNVAVFTVNTSTWDVTRNGSFLNFHNTSIGANSCYKIDTNHFINFWFDAAGNTYGYAQVFTVNTSTWAVTTSGDKLQTTYSNNNRCRQVDSNHFINYNYNSTQGIAIIFAVNTSTWAVSAVSSVAFDTQTAVGSSAFAMDSEHYINFWSGVAGDGFAQVFEVEVPTIWTSALIDGIKLGDSSNTFYRILLKTLTDGIKVGDVLAGFRAKVATLTDGIKLGDLVSSAIDPITAWVNKLKTSTIWTNKRKRE